MDPRVIQLALVAAVYAVALLVVPLCAAIAGRDDDADRHRHLDGMRGLAAVGVVATHVGQYAWAFLGYTEPPLLVNHAGILGVQLFFALTAFLFTERALQGRLTPGTFLVGRIRRIVPLYAFVVAAALALGYHYTGHVEQPLRQTLSEALDVATYGFWQTPDLTFRGLNMLSLIGIAWTLCYEWLFYLLLVPIAAVWRASRALRWPMVAAIGLIAVRDFARHPEQVIWPFFLPGVVAAMARPYAPAWPRPVAAVVALSALPALAGILVARGFWTPLTLALAGWIFWAVLFSAPRLLQARPLLVLGRVSFSIYLLQYLVLFPVMRWSYGLQTVEAQLLACGGVVGLVVLASGVSYRWIERPWLRRPAAAPPVASPVGVPASAVGSGAGA